MPTPFSDIYDLAMVSIKDYQIDEVAKIDIASVNERLEGFLVRSVPSFKGCLTNLSYNLTTKQFDNDLSRDEQDILADFMVLKWWESITNDLRQVNLKLQGRDKKTHSSDANLKGKTKTINELREKVRQSMTDYEFENFNSVYIL